VRASLKHARKKVFVEAWNPSFLREGPRPGHIDLMIYQWLHSFDKARRVWKLGMNVERSFIDPARVDVEQTRISRGTKDLYGQATWFCARRGDHVTHRGRNGIFLAVASMEASEDEKLHTSNEIQDQPPLMALSFAGLSTIISQRSTVFSNSQRLAAPR
jgi:hypothetical protein